MRFCRRLFPKVRRHIRLTARDTQRLPERALRFSKRGLKNQRRLVDLGITPLQPTDDGLSLVPYTGADANDLTVGGELNKLASNVGIGRNIAGVHWRSDATESLKLGEAVAISILRDQKQYLQRSFQRFQSDEVRW